VLRVIMMEATIYSLPSAPCRAVAPLARRCCQGTLKVTTFKKTPRILRGASEHHLMPLLLLFLTEVYTMADFKQVLAY
jgi:hypothetical protein